MEPDWLIWAKALQAIAQNGITFSSNAFDTERYEAVRRIAAEMMARQSGADASIIEDLFRGQTGYATPKVDVRGAVFADDRILLVHDRGADGGWTLPGGWADVNESPSACVAREVEEEAGLKVVVQKLAAVYDRSLHPHQPPFPFHVYKMFFLCSTVGGQARPGLETSETGFFAEDALPPLSVTRVLPWQVKRMFVHHREPGQPTEFD